MCQCRCVYNKGAMTDGIKLLLIDKNCIYKIYKNHKTPILQKIMKNVKSYEKTDDNRAWHDVVGL